MSLLSAHAIIRMVEMGVVENSSVENVNATSLDIRLGRYILIEEMKKVAGGYTPHCLSLRQRDPLNTRKIDLMEVGQYILRPGEFILAQSIEIFHLPDSISAEYKLKSSMARIGLDHLNAGWCDAGWNNSVLTLELRNLTTFHEIELCYGDKIGQMIFFSHSPVGDAFSYATKGSYNGDKEVSTTKTERVWVPL